MFKRMTRSRLCRSGTARRHLVFLIARTQKRGREWERRHDGSIPDSDFLWPGLGEAGAATRTLNVSSSGRTPFGLPNGRTDDHRRTDGSIQRPRCLVAGVGFARMPFRGHLTCRRTARTPVRLRTGRRVASNDEGSCGRPNQPLVRAANPARTSNDSTPTSGVESLEVVAGVGIEPTTRGFSVRCSTN